MVNLKLFCVLSVLWFSPVILGQGSPNIVWEVQAFLEGIEVLSVSADGNTILTSNTSTTKFYDSSGNLIDSYTSGKWIAGGSISPTAEYFTVGYYVGVQLRGYSLVVRTEDHSVLANIQGNLSVFNSDESKIITAEDFDVGYIYNIPNWNNPIIFSNEQGATQSIDLSEDYIVIGGHHNPDYWVKLRDINTGALIYTFTDFNNWVSAVKVSPDGNILASGQGNKDDIDGAIKIWNLNDYSLIADLSAFTYMTNSITFSPDDLYMIASGRNGNYFSNFPEIKIWRTTDWNLIQTYDLNLDDYVPAVVNLPDSYKFVYSTGQGHLALADYSEVVPVELTSFRAAVYCAGQVELSWTTATETNNRIFEIQRKSSEGTYATIGFVNGAGTSTQQHNYSYFDRNVNMEDYSYRLKQADFNGHFTYSNEVEVSAVGPATVNLAQNYPNPFNPITNIWFSIPQTGYAKLAVYNILGQEVSMLINGIVDAGKHDINFDASSLPGGAYIYKLQTGNSVMVKKMMLLK